MVKVVMVVVVMMVVVMMVVVVMIVVVIMMMAVVMMKLMHNALCKSGQRIPKVNTFSHSCKDALCIG